jgi:hypothetical protein
MNLARIRQIGEYYTMLDNCDYQGEYKSKHRHILKFDEDENDMVEIGLKHALNHCGIFDGESIKPVQYSVKKGQAHWDDLDKDFLMTKVENRVVAEKGTSQVGRSTGRVPVSIIGEMDPYFLPTHFLICAAKSMKSSMFKDQSIITDLEFERDKDGNVTSETRSQRPQTLSQTVIDSIKVWLGVITDSDIDSLIKNIMGTLDFTVPVAVNRENDKGENITGDPFVASQVDDKFLQAVMAAIPQAKRDEVKTIVDNKTVPVASRADQVRDKILEYVNSNVAGMKSQLKTEDKVHEWYGNLKSEYTKLKQQETISSSKEKETDPKKIIGYLPTGSNLSGTPYQLVGRLDDYKSQFTNNLRSTLQLHLNGIKNTAESKDIKALAAIYLFIKMDKSVLNALVDKDIRIPLNFLIFQPHMQYLTRAIIKCKQNGGTGVMLTGHDNFMMSWESGRKSGQMHYTTHIRPFIYNPENVHVKPDVYVQQYEGGAGSRFYNVDTYKQKDPRELTNSLICVAIPVVETRFPLPMDISGRFHTQYVMQQMDGQGQFERQLHYSTAPRYVQMYQFGKDGKQGSDVPPMMTGRHHDNTVCYPGHHQLWDPTKNNFSIVKIGRGHWGKDVYPGCASVRHGSLDVLETQNYAVGLTN